MVESVRVMERTKKEVGGRQTKHDICILSLLFKQLGGVEVAIDQSHFGVLSCDQSALLAISDLASNVIPRVSIDNCE